MVFVVMFGIVMVFVFIFWIIWEYREVCLVQFYELDIYNYLVLLLSEYKDILYIGVWEVVFVVNVFNIFEKQYEVYWKVLEDKKVKCVEKGKLKQIECFNYIWVLQLFSVIFFYVCGINVFQLVCDYLNLIFFKFLGKNEDGKGRCFFDLVYSYIFVMVDGEFYLGMLYNFLGSEFIIF